MTAFLLTVGYLVMMLCVIVLYSEIVSIKKRDEVRDKWLEDCLRLINAKLVKLYSMVEMLNARSSRDVDDGK